MNTNEHESAGEGCCHTVRPGLRSVANSFNMDISMQLSCSCKDVCICGCKLYRKSECVTPSC